MTKTVEDQLEELQNRVHALQQFVLAHVVAADVLNRTLGDDTLTIARHYGEGLRTTRPMASMFVGDLVKAVLEFRHEVGKAVD